MADNSGVPGNHDNPDYTEFGIKINKFRFTLKVHKRASSAGSTTGSVADSSERGSVDSVSDHYSRVRMRHSAAARGRSAARPRASSSSSSIADSLRLLDLDNNAGSR